ncbi:patatin-like phospholipase family protein [Streptomyces sp. NPDC005820]|uniref:patatin-like phospholipase family protein n=1 Tax=Streptomyces sp. NPDC005820 TaxID=3157069 RepID=UPI0033C74308
MVVGPGGVLEAAHIGVGYALERHGFVPDMTVGTSAGALNGAIAAVQPHGAVVPDQVHRLTGPLQPVDEPGPPFIRVGQVGRAVGPA